MKAAISIGIAHGAEAWGSEARSRPGDSGTATLGADAEGCLAWMRQA